MGLFQRRQQSEIEVNYNISFRAENTKLIVGLGNPGTEYDLARHNIGFYTVDALVGAENGSYSEKKSLKCQLADLKVGSNRIIVIKPLTFMNLSGEAVQAVQRFYKLSNKDTIVIHDELDVDFGKIRTQIGGGAAGHNGIKSVIQHCGEDFGRIRIGIGPKKPDQIDSADFVLQKFSQEEQSNLKPLVSETIAIINEAIFGGELQADTRRFL